MDEQIVDQKESVEEVPQQTTNSNFSGKLNFYLGKIKYFWTECKRVFLITKKPDKEELKTIVKISGLGILAIGLIGFLINLSKELFLRWR